MRYTSQDAPKFLMIHKYSRVARTKFWGASKNKGGNGFALEAISGNKKKDFTERKTVFAPKFTVKIKNKTKMVFTELKADFTRNWQTKDILLG